MCKNYWFLRCLETIVHLDRVREDVGGEVNDRADDDDRRGRELGRFDLVQDSLECADELGLVGMRAPADQGDRSFGAESGSDEFGKNVGEIVDTHIDNEGFSALGDGVPVDSGPIFFGAFVPRNKGDARAVVAMGEGNTCVGWGGNAGGDTRDDFDGDAEFGEIFKFFTAPSENKWISTFQSDDAIVLIGFLDDEFGGVFLFERMLAFTFTCVDFFSGGVDHSEDGRADESVIDYAISSFKESFAFEGEESRVTRSSAHEVDGSEGKGVRFGVLHD